MAAFVILAGKKKALKFLVTLCFIKTAPSIQYPNPVSHLLLLCRNCK
jgi:hypothetical protein